MAYKILTKKGIETTNIDGARENFFNSGMRDGIVKGAFNEGKFASNSSNSIYLDSCELRIAGHRVIIDEPIYKTFSNIPSKNTRYSMVAQITVSDSSDVSFSLFVQSVETVLIKDNLYATTTGQGTYQVEIGRFTLTNNGTIEDVVKTIDTITGATESIAGGINIGNVTTQKIDYNLDAEVDVNQRYDSEQKKTFTDFNFQLPTQYPVDLDQVERDVQDAKSKATEAVNTANSANLKTTELENNKADRSEIPSTQDFATKTELSSVETKANSNTTSISTLQNNKADLTNVNQTITANDITLQGTSMFQFCSGLGARDYIVEQGSDYVRWANGWQMCVGNFDQSGAVTVTFPKPFLSGTSYAVCITGVTNKDNTASARTYSAQEKTATYFKTGALSITIPANYIAVGKWK